jgi:hypothetical protein
MWNVVIEGNIFLPSQELLSAVDVSCPVAQKASPSTRTLAYLTEQECPLFVRETNNTECTGRSRGTPSKRGTKA